MKFNLNKFKSAQSNSLSPDLDMQSGDMSGQDVWGGDPSQDLSNPAGGEQPQASQPMDETPKYTQGGLLDELNEHPVETMEVLKKSLPDVNINFMGKQAPLNEVLSPEQWGYMDSSQKGQICGEIFNILPDNMKDDGGSMSSGEVPAEMEKVNVEARVKESNEAIKKIAQSTSKTKKTFNLRKTAAGGVAQNTIVFGPREVLFPTVQEVGNDWDLVQRNKGWGKKIDEFYGQDYEMIWRQNIMDKFYREFRDKDGKWSGGYIEKRFEVDKNIPSINNMQLLPGQMRKPFVPEYHLTELRLEKQRVDNGVSGSHVFNWHTASSNKMVKTASKKKVEAYNPNPQANNIEYKSVKNCPVCGALRGGAETSCSGCGASFDGGTQRNVALKGLKNRPGRVPLYNKPNTVPQVIQVPKFSSNENIDKPSLTNVFQSDQMAKAIAPSSSKKSIEDIKKHHADRRDSFERLF